MADFITKYFVSPTLLRVVRVFRVGRVLRLVKSAKGIRTLLFSLAVSLPALFNIGLLLFLVMFIYAIFGMSFFMHTAHTQGIDDMFNFETFGRSMIILFQISTSAGWNSVLAGLMNDQPPECDPTPKPPEKPNGDCGNAPLGIFYLVTYLVISFLVVINMYIAVILENFSQATEDVQQGLTQDDFDMYYEIWERFDEEATEYIPLEKLTDFCDSLEEPLRIPQPNHYRLVFLDITICEGDKIHCLDILDALTKNFLGTAGDPSADIGEIKKAPDRADYVPVSSLLRRQREQFCARVIQRSWRNKVEKRKAARGEREGIVGSLKGGEQTIIRVETVAEEDEEELEEEEERQAASMLLGLHPEAAYGVTVPTTTTPGADNINAVTAKTADHSSSSKSTSSSSTSSSSDSSSSSSSSSASPSLSQKSHHSKKDDDGGAGGGGGDADGAGGSGSAGGGGAGTDRTVELYPESGVVA